MCEFDVNDSLEEHRFSGFKHGVDVLIGNGGFTIC